MIFTIILILSFLIAIPVGALLISLLTRLFKKKKSYLTALMIAGIISVSSYILNLITKKIIPGLGLNAIISAIIFIAIATYLIFRFYKLKIWKSILIGVIYYILFAIINTVIFGILSFIIGAFV
jgi:hypothetical protein